MKEKIENKIRFFLYNYFNTNELIKEREKELINITNISGNSWIKGRYCNLDTNSVENQAIRIIEYEKYIKRWHLLNRKVLIFLRRNYHIHYKFIKLKYIEKKTESEIEEIMKIDFKEQKIIDGQVIRLIYKNAKLRNLN